MLCNMHGNIKSLLMDQMQFFHIDKNDIASDFPINAENG